MSYYGLLKELGFSFTSKVPAGAAYIMPDGKFLDLSASMKVIDPSGSSKATHPALDEFLIEKGYLGDDGQISRVLCSSDNAIRVNDGTNFSRELVVGLPPVRPTDAQFASLENWLYSVFSKGGVDVGNASLDGAQVKHYDFSSTLPEEVIKNIKRFYASGKLLDSIAKKSV